MFDSIGESGGGDTCTAYLTDPVDLGDWHVPPPEPSGLPDLDLLLAGYTLDDAPLEPQPALADRSPGPWLTLTLDLDHDTALPAELSDHDLIDAIIAWERTASWAVARQTRLIAEFRRRRPGDDPEAVMCDRPWVASRWAPTRSGWP